MACADTYQTIRREVQLPPDVAQQLATQGFVVLPGPSVPGGIEQLQAAYDAVVATADPSDVRAASSTRVRDFVNRSIEFDGIYVYPPLLAACCSVIGRPFKLSNTCARTLNPGAPAQDLHADVRFGADGWPLVGYIWMIDAFDSGNGATRFVSGSHRWGYAPNEHPGGSGDQRRRHRPRMWTSGFTRRLRWVRMARPHGESVGAPTAIRTGALRFA